MEGVTLVKPSEIRDSFLAALVRFDSNNRIDFNPTAQNWGKVQAKLGIQGVVNKIYNGEQVDLSRVPETHRERVRYALEAAGLTEYAVAVTKGSYYGNKRSLQVSEVPMERPERDYMM